MDVAALIERMRSRAITPGNWPTSKCCRNGREICRATNAAAGQVDAAAGRRGVAQLYSHQCEALEAARAGRDFVVTTGQRAARRSATTCDPRGRTW